MADENVQILTKETYLKCLENASGSRLFNSLFVQFQDSGSIEDILNDGEYSCAFFVSNVLFLFGCITKPVVTVESLVKVLQNDTRWSIVKFDDLQPGDVIIWEKVKFEDGSENAHSGFALTTDTAVSTSSKEKMITQHPINNRGVDFTYRFDWSQKQS